MVRLLGYAINLQRANSIGEDCGSLCAAKPAATEPNRAVRTTFSLNDESIAAQQGRSLRGRVENDALLDESDS
jgi:hypothetical protein